MERVQLPSDRRMEMVQGALLRFSKRSHDINERQLAYCYYRHISHVDLTLEQLSESTGDLPRIVAAAIDAYLPAQHGDHLALDIIKIALKSALPGYTPVQRYLVSPDSSEDDSI